MKLNLPDKGTNTLPWVSFTSDTDTGVSIIDSKLVYILDGKDMELTDWLNGIQAKGHIDRVTKWAIMGAVATGDATISAFAKRFMGGGG